MCPLLCLVPLHHEESSPGSEEGEAEEEGEEEDEAEPLHLQEPVETCSEKIYMCRVAILTEGVEPAVPRRQEHNVDFPVLMDQPTQLVDFFICG